MDTDHALPDELAALRAAFAATGSCRPPLGWESVRAFEAAHGIVLPEPYRTCVAEICDGCADGPPEYGLVPLAALPDCWGPGGEERDLARPFPLTQAWFWDRPDAPPPSEEEVGRVFGHGAVVLGTEGCGMYWHLVVSGPHRGHVWLVTGEGAGPYGTEFGDLEGAPGFAGWVARWAASGPWLGDD